MALKCKDIVTNLRRKGFVLIEGGQHTRLVFQHEDAKAAVSTILSRGSKDIGKNLQARMARQLHISSGEFGKLVECELTQEGFMTVLRERGILKPKDQGPEKVR